MAGNLKQSPLKLRGSMTLTGNLDEALNELKKEREISLELLIAGSKSLTSPKSALRKRAR